MRITSTGLVGIGITSPATLLQIESTDPTFRVKRSDGSAYGELTSDTSGLISFKSDPGNTANGSGFIFTVDNSEKARIDSDGDLLVGLTTALSTQAGSIQAAGPILAKSYINSHTSSAIVIDHHSNVSRIRTYGATSGTGVLAFNTGGGGGAADSEAMRIDSSGNVGLGVTSVSNARFRIKGANNNTGAFNDGVYVESNNTSVYKKYSWMGIETQGGMHFSEVTGGVGETMRINSDGDVFIGTTTVNPGLSYQTPGTMIRASAGNYIAVSREQGTPAYFNRDNNTGTIVSFRYNGSERGTITTDGTVISVTGTSDYRLKENNVNISDGITRLKLLKPYRFNFKETPSKTIDGFFAHEVNSVVPEAVFGEKDAVVLKDSEDGTAKKDDPIYQQIDQSKLVPLLVAALQEAVARIEALEAK
jgi:hypothetical protein